MLYRTPEERAASVTAAIANLNAGAGYGPWVRRERDEAKGRMQATIDASILAGDPGPERWRAQTEARRAVLIAAANDDHSVAEALRASVEELTPPRTDWFALGCDIAKASQTTGEG